MDYWDLVDEEYERAMEASKLHGAQQRPRLSWIARLLRLLLR